MASNLTPEEAALIQLLAKVEIILANLDGAMDLISNAGLEGSYTGLFRDAGKSCLIAKGRVKAELSSMGIEVKFNG